MVFLRHVAVYIFVWFTASDSMLICSVESRVLRYVHVGLVIVFFVKVTRFYVEVLGNESIGGFD